MQNSPAFPVNSVFFGRSHRFVGVLPPLPKGFHDVLPPELPPKLKGATMTYLLRLHFKASPLAFVVSSSF